MAASDPVTAIANALTQAGIVAMPFIEESLAQKYEKENIERMEKWNKAQSIDDAILRADASWNVLLGIISEAGEGTGRNGSLVGIPSQTLATLVEIASKYITLRKQLARVQFKKD